MMADNKLVLHFQFISFSGGWLDKRANGDGEERGGELEKGLAE